MSVLSAYFDSSLSQSSPVLEDWLLQEKVGKDGAVSLVPVKQDIPAIQKSLGTVDNWSISALLAAGINPGSLNVHTGFNSRIEGVNAINGVLDELPETVAETVIEESAPTTDNTVLANSVFDNTNKIDE